MQQQLTPEAQSFDNKEDIKSDLHKGNLALKVISDLLSILK